MNGLKNTAIKPFCQTYAMKGNKINRTWQLCNYCLLV